MRKGLEKAYEITDAKISFVSLVDKAANKRQFLFKERGRRQGDIHDIRQDYQGRRR